MITIWSLRQGKSEDIFAEFKVLSKEEADIVVKFNKIVWLTQAQLCALYQTSKKRWVERP